MYLFSTEIPFWLGGGGRGGGEGLTAGYILACSSILCLFITCNEMNIESFDIHISSNQLLAHNPTFRHYLNLWFFSNRILCPKKTKKQDAQRTTVISGLPSLQPFSPTPNPYPEKVISHYSFWIYNSSSLYV